MSYALNKKETAFPSRLDLDRLSYRDLLKNSPDGLIVFDTHDIIHAFNKGAEDIFGYSSEEVLGRPFYFLIPLELLDKGEIQRLQEMVNANGRLERCYVTRLHKNGSRIKLELTRSQILDEQGVVIGYECVFRDVTQSIEFEKELLLTEKLSAVETLVSGMAHELGTSLNIIQGHSDLILTELSPDSPFSDSLKTIIQACDRMAALMKTLLLDVSRREREIVPLDIGEIIRDLLNFLRIQIKKQNIKTSLDIQDDIPFFQGDRTQIEEILLNIMMNSIQAMPDGGELKVRTATHSENGWDHILMEIKDNGVGIPLEILSRIFEPFFTTKGVGKGAGLGLYITHNLVRRYKGRIKVESAPGCGCSVSIFLPVGPYAINRKEDDR
ncbi:PAS domain S-box protein [Candidatus Sumerlaeota bacterium]|nr:PAS domain S-box protein [Candidatus Sumerlaeota bacterium]